jgi:hypothetical protein
MILFPPTIVLKNIPATKQMSVIALSLVKSDARAVRPAINDAINLKKKFALKSLKHRMSVILAIKEHNAAWKNISIKPYSRIRSIVLCLRKAGWGLISRKQIWRLLTNSLPPWF